MADNLQCRPLSVETLSTVCQRSCVYDAVCTKQVVVSTVRSCQASLQLQTVICDLGLLSSNQLTTCTNSCVACIHIGDVVTVRWTSRLIPPRCLLCLMTKAWDFVKQTVLTFDGLLAQHTFQAQHAGCGSIHMKGSKQIIMPDCSAVSSSRTTFVMQCSCAACRSQWEGPGVFKGNVRGISEGWSSLSADPFTLHV